MASQHLRCLIVRSAGTDHTFAYDEEKALAPQLAALCCDLGVATPERCVLVGPGRAAPILHSQAPPPGSQLELCRVEELAAERLKDLERATLPTEVLSGLTGLLVVLRSEAVSDEVVERGGMRVLLRAALQGEAEAELAMACVCEMLRGEKAQGWLDDSQHEISVALFAQLLEAIFPERGSANEGKPRRACLLVCIFLLHVFPGVSAPAAHAAAYAEPSTGQSLYSRLLAALEGEEERRDEFQSVASLAVLAAMVGAADCHGPLRERMRLHVASIVGSGSEAESLFGQGAEAKDQVIEQLVVTAMSACAELADQQGRAAWCKAATADLSALEHRVSYLHETCEKMKVELRQRHQVMCAMVCFLRVESSDLVEQSLDTIVRYGWDSVNWKHNYNLLHYVAECVNDPSVAELVALTSTDVDARDDDNMRPIDYARKKNRREVGEVLERLRGRTLVRTRTATESLEEEMEAADKKHDHELTASLIQRVSALKGVPEPLVQAIELVLEVGWAKVQWPSDFTALHLAARCGSAEAVELLLDSAADPRCVDKWGLTPVEYAVQDGHLEASSILRRRISGQSSVRSSQHRSIAPASSAMSAGNEPPPEQIARQNGSSHRASLKLTGRENIVGAVNGAPELGLEERQPPTIPSGLPPELQKACEVVQRKGWTKVKFPHNFTALHLAAMLGCQDAVSFLLLSSAWPGLHLKDTQGNLPLDYAREKGFPSIVELLQGAAESRGACDAAASKVSASRQQPFESVSAPGAAPLASAISAAARHSRDHIVSFAEGHGSVQVGASITKVDSFAMRAKQRLDPPQHPSLPQGPESTGGPTGLPVPPHVASQAWDQSSHGSKPSFHKSLSDFAIVKASRNCDVTKREGEEQGNSELRSEVRRLKAQLRVERGKRECQDTNAGNVVSSVVGGPLDEAMLSKFWRRFQAVGSEAVCAKLCEAPLSGGLALDEDEARAAVRQFEMLERLFEGKILSSFGGSGGDGVAGPGEGPGGLGGPGAGGGKGGGGKAAVPPPGKGKDHPPAGKGAPKGSDKGSDKGAEKGAEKCAEKGANKGPEKGGKGKGKDGKPGGKGKGKGKGADGKPGGGVQPSKPVITPSVPMKALWWSKYILGIQIEKGETIWDQVQDATEIVPIEELEERFAKNSVAPQVKDESVAKSDAPKSIEIITDSQLRVGKEAAMKMLPSLEDLARALVDLDEHVLDVERLHLVQDAVCPSREQLKMLTEARKKQPGIPMAVLEQYMWIVGHSHPMYLERLECWAFTRTYQEQERVASVALRRCEEIVGCFLESKILPVLLSLILAVGNHLNGSTPRGQADGFDLETLRKLEAVRDAVGKDVRHFIFGIFYGKLSEQAEDFLEELRPVLQNVRRQIVKDSEGVEKLEKAAVYTIEDFDREVLKLQSAFTAKHEVMQMVLQDFNDPADPFKLRMPEQFNKAKESISVLVQLRDRVSAKFKQMLAWFKVTTITSGDFCLLWDNLLIPGDLILNRPDAFKKKVLMPMFCQQKAHSLDDFLVLWDFKGSGPERDKEKEKDGKSLRKDDGKPKVRKTPTGPKKPNRRLSVLRRASVIQSDAMQSLAGVK